MNKKELIDVLEENGYNVERTAGRSAFAKKGNMEIEVDIFCEPIKQWKMKLDNYIHLKTYYTKENGDCAGIYNPTCFYHEEYGYKGFQINLEKVLEPTKENLVKLIEEMEYMQKNDIHYYIEKNDSRKLA